MKLLQLNMEGAATPAPPDAQKCFDEVVLPPLGDKLHIYANLFTTARGTFIEEAEFGYASFNNTKNCAGVTSCWHIAITQSSSYILYER